ncbi:hypothetical protein HC928_07830 [bacterium]|nr:hypothetical protein [bacterium]
MLRPIIRGEPTPANLIKIAEDPKIYKRLKLAMGEEGANEIRQIAKDLIETRKALSRIPKHALHEMDAIYPLKWIFGAPFYGVKKMTDLGRRAYGVYLSSPATRKAISKAIEAVPKGNIEEYKKATDILKNKIISKD